MRSISFAIPTLLLLVTASQVLSDDTYGNINPKDYVIGKFDAETSSMFDVIRAIPTSRPLLLRKEALAALNTMYRDFTAQNPGITFPIISATRNYTYQAGIWDRKWTGSSGNVTGDLNRALDILKWSAMPGTSRHHWGTDLDLYSLENGDFDSGNGMVIYNWLRKNAATYGFCQPYTSGRCTGYNEEKWHWSFCPLSKIFLKDWNAIYLQNLCTWVQQVNFRGASAAAIVGPTFVNTINPECI